MGVGPASAPIIVSSAKVELSDIPVGPSGTTTRYVYRKQINGGDGLFHLVGSPINNNTAGAAFEDNTATSTGVQPQTSKLYIDVTFKPTPGSTLDYKSILDNGKEFDVSGGATNSGAVDFSGAPTPIALVTDPASGALVATPLGKILVGGVPETDDQFWARLASLGVTRFRYTATTATASYSVGDLNIDWKQYSGEAGWQDSNGNPNLFGPVDAPGIIVKIQGPTADLADPLNGGGVDLNKLNKRGYIDVIFDAPPAGYAIDFGSIKDATPEIRLAGDGVGTVILDNSQAPLVLDEAQRRVRYWVTGKFGVGDVHAIFVPGTWSFTKAVSPTDTSQQLTSSAFLDVTFPATPAGNYVIDPASVNGDEITLRQRKRCRRCACRRGAGSVRRVGCHRQAGSPPARRWFGVAQLGVPASS